MSLREYLKAIKIDEIEDDREFCEEEYNAGAEIDIINDIQAKVLLKEILLQI